MFHINTKQSACYFITEIMHYPGYLLFIGQLIFTLKGVTNIGTPPPAGGGGGEPSDRGTIYPVGISLC